MSEIRKITITDEQRQSIACAIAQAIGEAYDCTRVWSAWGYGTMGPDDFVLVAEDSERVAEIADAVVEVVKGQIITALLAELERMESSRESECMECEKLTCIEIADLIKAHFKLQEAPK